MDNVDVADTAGVVIIDGAVNAAVPHAPLDGIRKWESQRPLATTVTIAVTRASPPDGTVHIVFEPLSMTDNTPVLLLLKYQLEPTESVVASGSLN